MITLLIQIVGVALICWLLWYLVGYMAVPEPFNKVLRVVIMLVAIIYLVRLIAGVTGVRI